MSILFCRTFSVVLSLIVEVWPKFLLIFSAIVPTDLNCSGIIQLAIFFFDLPTHTYALPSAYDAATAYACSVKCLKKRLYALLFVLNSGHNMHRRLIFLQ